MAAPSPSKKMKQGTTVLPFVSLFATYSDEGSCDVVIVVEGKRFEAHRCIISAASTVFKIMITNGMQESVSKEIVLKSVKKENWELILKFMYTGKVEIENEESCLDILHFAHQYEMNLLLNMAEIQLIEYTSTDSEKTAIESLLLAEKLGLLELAGASVKNIGQCFIMIYNTQEFQNLPFRMIHLILNSEYLLTVSKIDIVEAIIRWATNSLSKKDVNIWFPPLRILEARQLLRSVKISELSTSELKVLSHFPGVGLFPEFLGNLIKKGNLVTHKTPFQEVRGIAAGQERLVSKRYDNPSVSNRTTLLLIIQIKEMKELKPNTWISSAWYQESNNGERKFRLRVRKGPKNIYCMIDPIPKRPTLPEILLLSNNKAAKLEYSAEFEGKSVKVPISGRSEDAFVIAADIYS